MPRALLLAAFACAASPSFSRAQPPPKSIRFEGRLLELKEQKGDAKRGFIAEYIPPGKTWDDWDLMFAVRFTPGPGEPAAAAKSTAKNIEARRAQGVDPVAHAAVFKSDSDASYAVDFLMSAPAKQGSPEILEHNVWRYVKRRNGLLSYQLARRLYPGSAPEAAVQRFIKEIPGMREPMLSTLKRADLPVPPGAD